METRATFAAPLLGEDSLYLHIKAALDLVLKRVLSRT